MTTDVTVPAAGESVNSANVAVWHHSHGEVVKAGDVLCTLETDKVSNELEAPVGGTLEVVVPEGEEVPIGTVIAKIHEGDAPQSSPAKTADEPQDEKPHAAQTQAAQAEPAQPTPEPEPAEQAKETSAASDWWVDIVVPAAGESISSASVANWRKSHGDKVREGETVVLLETDKVSNELEAPASGILEIMVAEGEEVPIGEVIGRVRTVEGEGSDDDAATEASVATEAPSQPKETSSASAPEPAPEPKPEPSAQAASAPGQPKVAPQQSEKPDFSLPPVKGGMSRGEAVSDGRTTRRKMSMLRRKIATHLVNAQQTAAILTTFNEVDMSAVMKLRKEVQEEFIKKHGVKLGFMSFFVKAVTQALKDVPSINGRIEGNEVIENHYYDIGVAIGTEKGLFVPVIRDADEKSFAEIEKDILEYASRAKDGKITMEDLQGGVFSISNGGTYGSLLSTPILNPPQSGILGMHTIQQRPVAVDGEVVIRPMMYLALSYDHRLVDGKEAVTFLIRIKECLESPTRLLLEM